MDKVDKIAKAKILLVDDRHENLHALESLLASDHAEIFKAYSGREALELLLEHRFAVALLDVQMPEINGFELAELIRGAHESAEIPIIFVTAGAIDAKHTFRGYEAGAVDFLYKPLDPRIVKSKVEIFLRLDEQRRQIFQQMSELQVALKAREEFLSIASHELKTPLTSLTLQFQLASRSLDMDKGGMPTRDRLVKIFDLANRQVAKITNLIEELLDVSRIQEGKLTINKSLVNLNQVILEVVERLGDQLEQAECKVQLNFEGNLVVSGEPFRIEQVLVNLISNVIKYSPGSPVIIGLKKSDKYIELSVRDEGPGIPPNKLDMIFERFERLADPSKVSGLGLGLYIVRQIMHAHDGEIFAESTEGMGSTFTAKFPIPKN